MGASRSSPLSTLLSDAAAAISRGDHAKALAHYRTASRLDPNNPMHALRTGDCLARLGRKEEARLVYRHVAERYALDAQYVRAISVWRLLLRLAPEDEEAAARLAELHALRRKNDVLKHAVPPAATLAPFLPVIELPTEESEEPAHLPRPLGSLWDEPATAPAGTVAALEATVRTLLAELQWIRRELEVIKSRTFVSEAALTAG